MLPSEYIRQGWCQGAMARDVHGEDVPDHSPNAVSYCVIGAIRQWGRVIDGTYVGYLSRLMKITQQEDIPGWNDAKGRDKEDVIASLEMVEEELGL